MQGEKDQLLLSALPPVIKKVFWERSGISVDGSKGMMMIRDLVTWYPQCVWMTNDDFKKAIRVVGLNLAYALLQGALLRIIPCMINTTATSRKPRTGQSSTGNNSVRSWASPNGIIGHAMSSDAELFLEFLLFISPFEKLLRTFRGAQGAQRRCKG